MNGFIQLVLRVPEIFGGEEFEEITVDVDWEGSPGNPGRRSGPPEDCYPPEPPEISASFWCVEKNDPLHDLIQGVRKLGTKANLDQIKALAEIEEAIDKELSDQANDLVQNEIDAAAENSRRSYDDD